MIEEAATSKASLVKDILRHRKLYNAGVPVISDEEFDKLEMQLRQVDPTNPVLDRHSTPIDKGDHKLPVPLPSLNKIRPDMGADKWLNRYLGPYTVSDKLDGLSAEIKYVPGKPTKAYSSGDDGVYGKDISHLLPYMGVPLISKKDMVVRVELIMTRADFLKFWAGKFKNARNLATGIKNKTTGIHEAAKHYNAVALAMLEPRMKPSVAFAQLQAMGFKVAPFKVFPSLTVAKLQELFAKRKKASPYDIDGLVIEQDVKTSAPRDYPEHQVAFKDVLQIDSAQARVVRVDWRMSRYGKLTPVVVVEQI